MENSRDVRYDHPNGVPCSMNAMDDNNDNIIEEPPLPSGGSTSMNSRLPPLNLPKNDPFTTAQELQLTPRLNRKSPETKNNNNRGGRPRSSLRRSRLFSAKELNNSIVASENTRIICSVLIALLVVLSYIDYPLLGINIVNSKSIIAMKPLYMVLVTEITVLIAHLVLERRRRIEDFDEDDKRAAKEAGLNWDRAVRVLERGLVGHQTVRAIFIDCSVYVVIVVCGLCLV